MQLVISANKEPFQLTRQIKLLEIRLAGNYHSAINLMYDDNRVLKFENGAKFFRFGERLKGSFQTTFQQALQEFDFAPEIIREFSHKSQTEIGLFKSVFLIYSWVELAFTDAYAVQLSNRIYNEFIVDYSNKVGTQNDLYFIKQAMIVPENLPLINRLMEINLLASALFSDNEIGTYQTYFIPLIRPGVSREHFNSPGDLNGNKTYELWKTILRDRDARISNWFTNRY